MDLTYVIDKINAAPLTQAPFLHLEIDALFEPQDFEAIVNSVDLRLPPSATDEELFDHLFASNYRIISFPGCTENHREYIRWHQTKEVTHVTNTACEGFGVVLRLLQARSEPVRAVQQLLESPEFIACIARKFGVDPAACTYDSGIQKYLDGYEISPHPDVRRKALTFMVNVNPDPASERMEHHTHYLKFKPERRYVEAFWAGNPGADRGWVPWDWCESQKQQRANNSIVIFAPSNDTMHAVKARYDHLRFQRTQLYGNLWHAEKKRIPMPSWEDMAIEQRSGDGIYLEPSVPALLGALKDHIAARLQQKFRRAAKTDSASNLKREY